MCGVNAAILVMLASNEMKYMLESMQVFARIKAFYSSCKSFLLREEVKHLIKTC